MKFEPEKLVGEYGDYLYRYAMTRLMDPVAAEEVVQETFLSAIQSGDSFAGKSSLRTWLVGILKHKIVDHIRKASRERPYEASEDLSRLEEEHFTFDGSWRMGSLKWHADPGMISEKREFWEAFRKCMSTLPSRHRDVFILREMEGKNSQEICMILEISPTNLWVMLHRVRLALRSCLEESWFKKTEMEK